MADKPKTKRKLRTSTETVRQKAQAVTDAPIKKRRIRSTASKVVRPIKVARKIGKQEYYLPLPDNRVGRFMNKRRYVIPRYFRESWAELKQVTWPDRKETTKLTLAVFAFAIIFGILVAVVDYGLDIIFRKVVLK